MIMILGSCVFAFLPPAIILLCLLEAATAQNFNWYGAGQTAAPVDPNAENGEIVTKIKC